MYPAAKIFTLFSLVAACLPAAAGDPRPMLQLSEGSYKYLGHCEISTNRIGVALPSCLEYAAVIAKTGVDEYQFLFPLEGEETLLYMAGGPVEFSHNGAVATYLVKELLDTTSDRAYSFPGECTMSARTEDPLIRCTTWEDEAKTNVVREVIFRGNRNWSFVPARSGP